MKREPQSFTLKSAERDILTRVGYLTTKPLMVKHIWRELLQSYSELQILEAVLSLLERGQLETVYSCGLELGSEPQNGTRLFKLSEGAKKKILSTSSRPRAVRASLGSRLAVSGGKE